MQETRQQILEILREVGHATVDTIVDELRERRGDEITAVTVRHHLNVLQEAKLITPPKMLHRNTPGRPQHVYELTERAQEHFPNNYQQLANELLEQIKANLPPEGVNVILEGVAENMAAQAQVNEEAFDKRMDKAVAYLNEHGYDARWEETEDGFILHTRNCPYHEIAQTNEQLCNMDMRLIASMLGVVPRLLSRISQGEPSCAYLIPLQK